ASYITQPEPVPEVVRGVPAAEPQIDAAPVDVAMPVEEPAQVDLAPPPVSQTPNPEPGTSQQREEPGNVETSLSQGTGDAMSPAVIDEIVRRVVAQLSESVVREIAWEVVPDCVERVIKEMTAREVSQR